MSSLVQQLRAKNNDTRSDRELTYSYGKLAEQNGWNDLFENNPDFAKEYDAIKEEISRANRPSYKEEFSGAFGSAVDSLQESGFALGALGADLVGADSVRNWALEGMREQEQEAMAYKPSVGSIKDINWDDHPVEDAARFATYGLGTLGPSIAQSIASGLAGAAAGSAVGPEGTIGGAVLGAVESNFGKKMATELAKKVAQKMAVKYGSQLGLAASSIGSEVGSIYAENPDAPGTAIAAGTLAGLLDVLPESYVLGKFFRAGEKVTASEAQHALGFWKRFATEAAKTVPMEAGTEAAQTLIEIAANKYGRGESVDFTDDDWQHALDAGVIGAIGGLGMAPVAAIPSGRSKTEIEPFTRQSTESEDEMGSAIPEQFTPDENFDEAAASIPATFNANPDLAPEIAAAVAKVKEILAADTQAQVAELPAAETAIQPAAQPAPVTNPELDQLRSIPEDMITQQQMARISELEAAPAIAPVISATETTATERMVPVPTIAPDPSTAPVNIGPRDASISTGTGVATDFEQKMMDDWKASIAAEQKTQPTAINVSDTPNPSGGAIPAQIISAGSPSPVGAISSQQGTPVSPPAIPTPTITQEPAGVAGSAPNIGSGVETAPTPAPASIIPSFALPTTLSGAKPNYSYGEKKFTLKFDSDLDRATYIVRDASKKSKSDAKYLEAIMQQTGMTEPQARAHGAAVAARIKPLAAKGTTGQVLRIATTKPSKMAASITALKEAAPQPSTIAPSAAMDLKVSKLAEPKRIRAQREFVVEAARKAAEKAPPMSQEMADDLKRLSPARGNANLSEAQQTMFANKYGDFITIEVPDDGTFKIHNTKEALTAFADKAEKRFGRSINKPSVSQRSVPILTPDQLNEYRVDPQATVRTSADYTVAPTAATNLYHSTIQALVLDRAVPVVAMQQAVETNAEQAAQTAGITLTTPQGGTIVALALDSVTGPVKPQSIVALLHEAGHVFTDGLPEPLRASFQSAIDQMPSNQQNWLMNPRSLDVRLMANADPATLSDFQREALAKLTPEEVASAIKFAKDNPEQMLREQMAEHLAQLGWDKAGATGMIDRLIRFVKDLWLKIAMAIQTTLKGAENVSPTLAQQFVENQWLQFIHQDAAFAKDALHSLTNWIGVPATERERVPNYPAARDGEMRMQWVDSGTGAFIPVSYGIHVPASLSAFLKDAFSNASRFVKENGGTTSIEGDSVQAQLTRRANFAKPMPFSPPVQTHTALAAINLEEEIYGMVHRAVMSFLPAVNGQKLAMPEFIAEWLRVKSTPEARRAQAIKETQGQTNPLTGKVFQANPKITVDQLPSYDEKLKDTEGNEVTQKLSEAQDTALQQTIFALRDTENRIQQKQKRDLDRLNKLLDEKAAAKTALPKAALKEMDELQNDLLTRAEIIKALHGQITALDSKFDPRMQVDIQPGAKYLVAPNANATEAEIMAAPRGVVPGDLRFSAPAKLSLADKLQANAAWLGNPLNRLQGAIYGTIEEQQRKLQQIPLGLKRAGVFGGVVSGIKGSLSRQLWATGIPSLVQMSKKIYGIGRYIAAYTSDLTTLGHQWDGTLDRFAKSIGRKVDGAFKENEWNLLMQVWRNIDESQRVELESGNPGNVVDMVAKGLNAIGGIEVKSPAQREAMRDLLLKTIDTERYMREVFLKEGMKVHDKEMGYFRRLVSHGLVTGRLGVSQMLTGLYQQMSPAWSDTTTIPETGQSFWDDAGGLYQSDRAAFDQKIAALFPSDVVEDFAEPLALNTVPLFDAPKDESGIPHKASLLNVRQAWRDSKGDITKFAQRLHALEGGIAGQEAETVGSVIKSFSKMFYEIKGHQDKLEGMSAISRETNARQMMDARNAANWPAAWTSASTYGVGDNLTLLHQLAMAKELGENALGANSEIAKTLVLARQELALVQRQFNNLYSQGVPMKEIERQMGTDSVKMAKNANDIFKNIGAFEKALQIMATQLGYGITDFRTMNELLGFTSSMMINQLRGAAVNVLGDTTAAIPVLGISRQSVQAVKSAGLHVVQDFVNSLVGAFGQNAIFNTELALKMDAAGGKFSDNEVTMKDKLTNVGTSMMLAEPADYEAWQHKVGRKVALFASRGKSILANVGSPLQKNIPEQRVSPKLSLFPFAASAQSTLNANAEAGVTVFSDLAMRGVEYINTLPKEVQAQFVQDLKYGVKDLDASQLGYNKGTVFNDLTAFNYLKDALETKMTGENGVGQFVAKAWERQQAAGKERLGKWDMLSTSQWVDIRNLTATDWTLQGNLASMPPWMAKNPLFIFLRWPYMAMTKFGRSFLDAQGRLVWTGVNSTVGDGMKAFFILSAPATIAGSFALDWYDKYILGKKQNMREAPASLLIPGVGAVLHPAAFVERIGRYGSAGFASDVLNQIVNYDTQRNLSLDNRIVAVNAINSLLNAVVVAPIQQEGNITYGSVVRPFFQSIGGGGVLQYLQIMNNAMGLNNEDAAINARINVGNYLRAAGHELKLPVRVFRGAISTPTAVSPYLAQMELAAGIDNPELFQQAFRKAVAAAIPDRGGGAEKFVISNFSERHPLKRIFTARPSETDYRRLLGLMDERGARQTQEAVNSYNRYMELVGKKSYYGKSEKDDVDSVEDLIKQATKMVSAEDELDSILAIP